MHLPAFKRPMTLPPAVPIKPDTVALTAEDHAWKRRYGHEQDGSSATPAERYQPFVYQQTSALVASPLLSPMRLLDNPATSRSRINIGDVPGDSKRNTVVLHLVHSKPLGAACIPVHRYNAEPKSHYC